MTKKKKMKQRQELPDDNVSYIGYKGPVDYDVEKGPNYKYVVYKQIV